MKNKYTVTETFPHRGLMVEPGTEIELHPNEAKYLGHCLTLVEDKDKGAANDKSEVRAEGKVEVPVAIKDEPYPHKRGLIPVSEA